MISVWRIELFGQLRVLGAEASFTRFRSRKTAALLAYLAYSLPRQHSRESLIDLFWPDSTLEAGRQNLRMALSSLRRQLEPPGTPAGAVILANRQSVGLNDAVVSTDTGAFETGLRAAAGATRRTAKVQMLEQALELHRDRLLPDFYDDWLAVEQERLNQLFFAAVRELVALLDESGEPRRALEYVRRSLPMDPLREEAHAEIMRLLVAVGEPAAALMQYRELERLLEAEIGMAPSAAVRAAAQRIKEQVSAAQGDLSSAPSDAALSSPRRRVPDQATRPAAPLPQETNPPAETVIFPLSAGEDSIALRTERAHVGRLPLSFTRFFGRKTEIAALTTLLNSEQTRLVTLMGPGGTGKTRLALETARRLVEPFCGAVWFVPLADISDSALIAAAISEAMGLPGTRGNDPYEHVVRALSGQAACLVLDNFEQLVELGAHAVQGLLERVSSLRVLVTSRQALGLTGEREFAVPALPTPQGVHTPAALTLYDSVQLFIDRAQAIRPDFQVTDSNAPAVAELCDRLEGLPLAVELAAARVQVLTPAQMLTQMEQRFDFLVSRKKDVTTRHRTLRAAIDWSYHLLSPEMQRFFARLSVFRGGWTMDAARAVCEDESALDLLTLLQECSLVTTAEEAGEMRFRMLESLREYARERLREQGELEATQGLHQAYFLALAEQAASHMSGPEQELWLERLEEEHENLRLALDACAALPEADTGLRLSAALARFWAVRGHLREGRERYAALLARPDAQAHTQARADALNGAGLLALGQGDHPVAQLLYEEGLALQRELSNLRGAAYALNALGIIAHRTGDYAAARMRYEESLTLRRSANDKDGVANSLNNLGALTEDQGAYTVARPLYEESLTLRRELGGKQGIANSLNNLGSLADRQGAYFDARSLYEESLTLHRALGDKGGVASVLRNLGIIAQGQGDYGLARSLNEESLALERELGNKGGAANTLITLGSLRTKEADFAGAHASLREALTLCRGLGDERIAAVALGACAQLAYRQRQSKRAARLLGAEQALRGAIGFPRSSGDQEEHALQQTQLEMLLGTETYLAAFAAGQSLSFEHAVEYALEWKN